MNEKTQTFTWVKNWEQRERESGLEIEILSHFWWSEGLKEKKRMCVGLRRDQHQTSLHHLSPPPPFTGWLVEKSSKFSRTRDLQKTVPGVTDMRERKVIYR